MLAITREVCQFIPLDRIHINTVYHVKPFKYIDPYTGDKLKIVAVSRCNICTYKELHLHDTKSSFHPSCGHSLEIATIKHPIYVLGEARNANNI